MAEVLGTGMRRVPTPATEAVVSTATTLAGSTTPAPALALLRTPTGDFGAARFVGDSSTPGQTENALVAHDVFAMSPVGAHAAATPPSALPGSPSRGARDRLFADLLSSGSVNALGAESLGEPLV